MKGKHPSILITDDDRQLRETLQEIFAPRGFRTFLASDGEQAVNIVRREKIDLLLLDNNMPRLSGLETVNLVRKFRPLPCILMSAHVDEAVRRQALQARVFSILTKPITCQQVTTTVEQALAAGSQ